MLKINRLILETKGMAGRNGHQMVPFTHYMDDGRPAANSHCVKCQRKAHVVVVGKKHGEELIFGSAVSQTCEPVTVPTREEVEKVTCMILPREAYDLIRRLYNVALHYS